jgi:hypothetical protein
VDSLSDSTQLLVPNFPVIMLAYAYALRERGESGGESVNEQMLIASSTVSDAIAIDSVKNPEDMLWYVQ